MLNKNLFLSTLFCFFLLETGCERNNCYKCYTFEGSFLAIKPGDTISFYGSSRYKIIDSINYYTQLGYSIDTFEINRFQNPPNDKICSKSGYSEALNRGDSCVITTN